MSGLLNQRQNSTIGDTKKLHNDECQEPAESILFIRQHDKADYILFKTPGSSSERFQLPEAASAPGDVPK